MKPLAPLSTATALSLALSGPALAQDVTIGVSFDKIEPFREAQIKAIDAAIEKAGAAQQFLNADKDAQRQASQVDTLISDGVNAIVAIPWDIEAAVTMAQVSEASGVPFVTMDQAPADLESVAYHVGGDPCADGTTAGEFFVKAADGQPFKLLEIQGGLANDNGIRRSRCLNDALAAAPNITVIAQVPTDWSTERAMIGAQNALQEHPDLNGIYQPWNDGPTGIFSALEARGRLRPARLWRCPSGVSRVRRCPPRRRSARDRRQPARSGAAPDRHGDGGTGAACARRSSAPKDR